jgi:hypothetical protein
MDRQGELFEWDSALDPDPDLTDEAGEEPSALPDEPSSAESRGEPEEDDRRAGASEDGLVIVRYDDDSFLEQVNRAAETPSESEDVSSDLPILRDATEQWLMAPSDPIPVAAPPVRPEVGAPGADGEESPSDAGPEEEGKGGPDVAEDTEDEAPDGGEEDPRKELREMLRVADWDAALAAGSGMIPAAPRRHDSTRRARGRARGRSGLPPAAASLPRTGLRPASRVDPAFVGLAAAVAVGIAGTVLSVLKAEPFRTWQYLFAWFPFLALVNWGTARRSPAHSILSGRAGAIGALLAASVPVWLLFELWNFRLENWYYVGVPDGLLARRIGVVLSFSTVLPGVFFLEELLAARGVFGRLRSRPFSTGPRLGIGLWITAAVAGLLTLVLPSWFFPLVWAVPLLALEPWLLRSGGSSLLREVAEGRPGRVARLLVAGMGCGLFWEAMNFLAGGRWVYTVPGVGMLKLFEMPLLGFLGFAPFALSCWSLAKALVRIGVLPDWEVAEHPARSAPTEAEEDTDASEDDTGGSESETAASEDDTDGSEEEAATEIESIRVERSVPSRVRAGIVVAAAVFSALVLEGMDRWTIDSFTPRPENVPGIPDGVAAFARPRGGETIRGLMELIEDGSLYMPGASSAALLEGLDRRCRLVLLRGIGTTNAQRLDDVGVRSVEDLAARERDELVAALAAREESGWRPRPRRVETWIEAARERIR